MNDGTAPLQRHNEAIALARGGDVRGACVLLAALAQSVGAARVDPRTLKALWQLATQSGQWDVGLAAGVRAAIRDPLDSLFTQRVLDSLARCPMPALFPNGPPPPMPMPATRPTLSVVVVSQDDARYAAVQTEYARAFADWPHQLIRVKGATSMYEGYERGCAQADGEVVVFSHDDIRFAVPDFAARLTSAMAEAHVVGVSGTTRLSGPAMTWAGHPHLFGSITQQDAGEVGYAFVVNSLAGPRVAGAQGLDGVFIAARRELIEELGFDTAGVPGFHFYDLDFTYRAHLAGARIMIAADLGIIHRSRGKFDDQWKAAQVRFARKFHFSEEPPPAERHHYSVRLPDDRALAEMYAKLFAAWELSGASGCVSPASAEAAGGYPSRG